MRVLTIGVLCGVLMISSCTRQEVNSVSPIKYHESDESGEIAIKTALNVPSWVTGAPIYSIGWVLDCILGGTGLGCPGLGAMLSGISFRK